MLEIQARMPLREFALDVGASTVEAGCLALAGPSGAGKTTVLRICAGLMRPAAGHVRCDGETWLDAATGIDLPPERRSCGYVFQDYALFPHMTAWQNVAYGLRPAGPRESGARRAEELLARFGAESLAGGAAGRALRRRAPARRAGPCAGAGPAGAAPGRAAGGARRPHARGGHARARHRPAGGGGPGRARHPRLRRGGPPRRRGRRHGPRPDRAAGPRRGALDAPRIGVRGGVRRRQRAARDGATGTRRPDRRSTSTAAGPWSAPTGPRAAPPRPSFRGR